MREIKFRAYSTVTGGFDYFSLADIATTDNSRISKKMIEDDISFMQYTGLNDKNGVEVYEGDILERDINCMYDKGRMNEEVKFQDCGFTCGDACLKMIIDSFNAKVVGNIFKTPELLEAK